MTISWIFGHDQRRIKINKTHLDNSCWHHLQNEQSQTEKLDLAAPFWTGVLGVSVFQHFPMMITN